MGGVTVQAGFGAVSVEIGLPVPMSGFAARTEPSVGNGSPPPRAYATAVDDVVLVLLDVVGVDPIVANAIRERADLRGTVTVAATHSHAGPCVLHGGLGTFSPDAFEAWVAAGAAAARAAHASQRAATVDWLEPIVAGIASNRRRGELSPDAPLKALRFVGVNGDLIGVLASYPCHPTSLGPHNRELSGDYPNFIRQTVEQEWGGACMFATGCAGDINTGHAATASYVLGSGDMGRTMADSQKIGFALARSVVTGSWSPVKLEEGVRWNSGEVTLQMRPIDTHTPKLLAEKWAAEQVDADPGVKALLDVWISWAQSPGAGLPATWTGSVGRLDIGDISVFLLPGEPFLDAAREIDNRSKCRSIALGYWEDCPGYLPAASEYEAGGYEVVDAHRYYGMPAPFSIGSMERVVDAALLLGTV